MWYSVVRWWVDLWFSKRHRPEPTLSIRNLNRIKSILVVMGYLFKGNQKYIMDYRMSLIKTATMRQKSTVKDLSGLEVGSIAFILAS